MTKEQLLQLVSERGKRASVCVQRQTLENMDLAGCDLNHVDFCYSSFKDVVLDHANLRGCSFENTLLDGSSLSGADLRDSNLKTASMRRCKLAGSDIRGADLYGAVLEYADLSNIRSDHTTKWFDLHCPATGAFIGFKKCVNDRIVQLLIPADAKRTSATMATCRCSRAKVLIIKNFDCTEYYEEAWSLVDENFVYRVGEWVEVKDFNEDRWHDSTTGIHFWMTRKEAMDY